MAVKSVCLVNTVFGTRFDAGAEKVVSLVASILSKDGTTVRIISIRPPTSADIRETADLLNVKHFRLRHWNVYFPFQRNKPNWTLRTLFHLLDNFNPMVWIELWRCGPMKDIDVLFSHSIRSLSPVIWLYGGRRSRIVRMHYLHDYQLMCLSSNMFKQGSICRRQCWSCRMGTAGRRLLTRRVDIVYGASEYILQRHLEAGYFSRARNFVLPPLLERVRTVCRVEEKVEPRRTFGFLGRISVEKGLHRLLNAFANLNLKDERFRNAKLIVAGTGEGAYFESMATRMRSIAGVEYVGFVEPSKLLEQVDALVVPSIWADPNPMVVVEAYAHGKPVIAARVGGLSTSVCEGATGLLFDHEVGDEGLVNALIRFLSGAACFKPEALAAVVGEREPRNFVDQIISDARSVQASSTR